MSAAAAGLSPGSFSFLRQHVYTGSGIVLQNEQQYLVEARLAPLARESGLGSLDGLCEALRLSHDSGLGDRVVEAMTTNETYFFREPGHYEALRETILPEMIRMREATRKLSFWSAASSSGQEAYSLAIMLLEMGLKDWNIDILGTDLSRKMLERAEQGRYNQLEVGRGLPTPLLLHYFRRSGLDWVIDDDVRRRVRFRQFDLRGDMRTLGPFDAVFCRNVLIYFDSETRQSILKQIHGTLFRGGCLLLGSAEAGLPPGNLYQRKNAGPSILYAAQ